MGGHCISEIIKEAYIGEYASGKSEVAVNRAISLQKMGRRVTLVDLDLVEPFYTLRPLKKPLMKIGIEVIAWETGETIGLGETGSIIKPEMRWVLKRPGDIILDIGYGVEGATVLNLIEGTAGDEDLQVFIVLNTGRPLTDSVEKIVSYVKELGLGHGLINNSHLGDDTSLEFVQEGAKIITEAARALGLPVVATYLDRKFAAEIDSNIDIMGNPIQYLDRYMINAFW